MPSLDILKRLDAYPKLSFEEMSRHSLGGAAGNICLFTLRELSSSHLIIVTIASTLVITLLVVLEFNAYLSLDVNEELFVDTTRNHKLQINLDISMPRISCDCKRGGLMVRGG